MKYLFRTEIGLLIVIGILGFIEPSIWLWGTLYIVVPFSIIVSISVFIRLIQKYISQKKFEILLFIFLCFNIILCIGTTWWLIKIAHNMLDGFMTLG